MSDNKDIIGITFKADTTDLKKGISEAQKEIRQANTDFKTAAAGMDNWNKSADGLTAKINSLSRTLAAQEKIIDTYEKEIERVSKQEGDHSARLEQLTKKLQNAQNQFNRTQAELQKFNKSLQNVQAEKLSKSLDQLKTSFSTLAKTISISFAGIVAGAVSLSESTREARKAMNQLYTSFDEIGLNVEQVNKVYQKFYGVIGDDSTTQKALASFANLARSQKDLDIYLNLTTGLFAKFGNSIPIDRITKSISETAAAGQVSGTLSKVLQQLNIDSDSFNQRLQQTGTAQERAALIADTLNNKVGDLAERFRNTNQSIIQANEVNNEYGNKLQDLGQAVEPLANKVKALAAQLIEEMIPTVQSITGTLEKSLPGILATVKALVPVVVSVGAGFAGWKAAQSITAIISSVQSLTKALQAAKVAQTALNVAMKSNVIGLVVAGVAALTAGIVALIAKQKQANKELKETEETVKSLSSELAHLDTALINYQNAANKVNKAVTETQRAAALNELNSAWQNVVNNVYDARRAVNGYISELEKIKNKDKSASFIDIESLNAASASGLNYYNQIIEISKATMTAGATTDQLKEKLKELGLTENSIAAIVKDTEKILQGANKPTATGQKSVIQTQLEQDLKDYNEFNKRLKEKQYKIDITPDGQTANTSYLDNLLKKSEAGFKRYSDYLAKLKELDKQALLAKESDIIQILDSQEKLNKDLLLSDRDRAEQQAIIDEKASKARLTEYKDLLIEMKAAGESLTENQQGILDKLFGDSKTIVKNWKSTLTDILNETNKWAGIMSNMFQSIGNAAFSVIDAVQGYWDNYYQSQYDALKKSQDEQDKANQHDIEELEKKYMNYEITLDEFKDRKAEIEKEITENQNATEEEQAKKKEEIQREQDKKNREIFEAQKAVNLSMLWITSAAGQVAAIANGVRDLGVPAGLIVGGVIAGSILTQTIAQSVVMGMQQYKSAFKDGVTNYSGGVALVGEEGAELVTLPTGSNVITNENTKSILTAVSRLPDLEQLSAEFARLKDITGSIYTNNYDGHNVTNNSSNSYNYTQNIYAPTTPNRLTLYRQGKRLLTLNK